MNKTFMMLKPDCIERRMIGNVISAIEGQSLNITKMKQVVLNKEQACDLYKEHKGKYYFDRNIKHVTSGPVIIMQVEGMHAITRCRELVETLRNAHRNSGLVRNPRNLLHATDEEGKVDEELSAVGLQNQSLTMAV